MPRSAARVNFRRENNPVKNSHRVKVLAGVILRDRDLGGVNGPVSALYEFK